MRKVIRGYAKDKKWMIELLSFCTATFRKSLAKVTRPAAAPPFGFLY